jgi:tRNA modification GTPase
MSYTGEDVVEFQSHGGPVVSEWLLGTILAAGARAAAPGEFTLRAFLNDKLDLTQAEAVADLVASGSRAAARAALRSLTGRFSAAVDAIQAKLMRVRVHIEAHLDFPDEDIDPATSAAIHGEMAGLEKSIAELLADARQGVVLRDGLNIAIVGPPNAGKSSLLNRLAGHDAAIVTDVPGTTRDTLRERIVLDGLPVHVVDTAGMRNTDDPIEKEGVRRARLETGRADLVLWLGDVREGLPHIAAGACAALGSEVPYTLVVNKLDLAPDVALPGHVDRVPVIGISALTGAGMEALLRHLKSCAGLTDAAAGTFSARRRHLAAIERAAAALADARTHVPSELELAAEDLRGVQAALGELTGEVSSDDLLGEIFSNFCIGK